MHITITIIAIIASLFLQEMILEFITKTTNPERYKQEQYIENKNNIMIDELNELNSKRPGGATPDELMQMMRKHNGTR